MRMDVNNDPGHRFPGRHRRHQPAGRGADGAGKSGHQPRRIGGPVAAGIDEITSTVTEGQSTTVVQLAIGTPIDRAVNDTRDKIAQIRSDLPEGILEPQVFRADTTDNDLASYSRSPSDMTVEQLSWYIDNTVAQGIAVGAGHGRGQPQRRRQPRNPRHPRSAEAAGAGPHRRRRSTRSCRQVNLNAAGGRAEIAGSRTIRPRARQCAQRQRPCADPDQRRGWADRSASRTSRRCAISTPNSVAAPR